MNWSLAPPSGAVKRQVAAHRVWCVQHVVGGPLPARSQALGPVLAAGLGEEAAYQQQAQRQARWCHPQARGGNSSQTVCEQVEVGAFLWFVSAP